MAESRLDGLEQQKAELEHRLANPQPGGDRDENGKVQARLKHVMEEIAKEQPPEAPVERSVASKAPEKAVKRTRKAT